VRSGYGATPGHRLEGDCPIFDPRACQRCPHWPQWACTWPF
jgi:hypothetical protein